MPQLTICFALTDPLFAHGFVLGGERGGVRTPRRVAAELADNYGVPLSGYLGQVLADAPRYRTVYDDDPVMQRGSRMALVAYALQCPTATLSTLASLAIMSPPTIYEEVTFTSRDVEATSSRRASSGRGCGTSGEGRTVNATNRRRLL